MDLFFLYFTSTLFLIIMQCVPNCLHLQRHLLSFHCQIEDQVDRQKAQAASTLDRLARQVAVEKQERAEKCKAFKVCTFE